MRKWIVFKKASYKQAKRAKVIGASKPGGEILGYTVEVYPLQNTTQTYRDAVTPEHIEARLDSAETARRYISNECR